MRSSALRAGPALALALAVAAALAALAAPARAADKPKGKDVAAVAPEKHAKAVEHFEKGKKLGEVGRYEESIAEFQDAYMLEPIPEILLNIALSHRFLKHHDAAIDFYQRYLRLKPDAPNRKEIEGIIKELEKDRAAAKKADDAAKKAGDGDAGKGPAHVTVTSDPPGARVRAGAKELGTTPLKAEIAPGAVMLRLELAGYEPKEVGVVAEPGRDALVAATLTPILKAGPAPAVPLAPGAVLVATNLPGAEISIDGRLVARAPMSGELPLPAGRYRLAVTAPAFDTTFMDLFVEPGRTTKLEATVMPTMAEAATLFTKHREKFLDSGLTIDGYWRKRKGTAELVAGGVMLGLSAAVLAFSAYALGRGFNTLGPAGGVSTVALIAVVGGPLAMVGFVYEITGTVKLASLGGYRWSRPAEAAVVVKP